MLPAANRALWLAGQAGEAVRGTAPTPRRRRERTLDRPIVAPLPKIDLAQSADALGRAWIAGLIDEPQRDAGRRFAILYWRQLPGDNPVAAIYRNMVSADVEISDPRRRDGETPAETIERNLRLDRILLDTCRTLDRLGRDTRRAIDQLCLDPWDDAGPAWLDRLIAGRALAGDHRTFALAIAALEALA